MTKRKTPVEHGVPGYTRGDGTRVSAYRRGRGSKPTRKSRFVGVVGRNWDKDFAKFTDKYDNRIADRFHDDPEWESMIDSIGRSGGTNSFDDHATELEFYIEHDITPTDIVKAAKELYNLYRRKK